MIDEEYIEARGLTNVADALNDLPGFGVLTSPAGEQNTLQRRRELREPLRSRNAAHADARQRPTRRSSSAPPTPGVQVDLNTITTQLVDRIETVSVGAPPPTDRTRLPARPTSPQTRFRRPGDPAHLRAERSGRRRTLRRFCAVRSQFRRRPRQRHAQRFGRQTGRRAHARSRLSGEAYFFALNPRGDTVEPGRTPEIDGRANPTPFAEE